MHSHQLLKIFDLNPDELMREELQNKILFRNIYVHNDMVFL